LLGITLGVPFRHFPSSNHYLSRFILIHIHWYAANEGYGLIAVPSFLGVYTSSHAAHYCFHWHILT